jgi:hypothetical protein
MNVLTGNKILSEQNLPSYFASFFPTTFIWGTCKHFDDRMPNRDPRPSWISKRGCSCSSEALRGTNLKLEFVLLMMCRRFQRHRGFVVLCYYILRRRHSLSKTNLLTSKSDSDPTWPLLESLTDEKLMIAANQAAKHKPISDR